MYGYIYLTTNLVNNKIYIGQHQAAEFEPDKYIGSGILLVEAINKYGRNNFKNELLCWCKDQEELNEKEIYYISKFNSTNKSIGYNISSGGLGVGITDEIRTKISETILSRHLHCYNNGIENRYFSEDDNIPTEFTPGRLLINTDRET